MVNRQVHGDLRDDNRAHDAVIGRVEQAHVGGVLRGHRIIAVVGGGTAGIRGERVLRLADGRLALGGELPVVCTSGGKRFLGLGVRPPINILDDLRG